MSPRWRGGIHRDAPRIDAVSQVRAVFSGCSWFEKPARASRDLPMHSPALAWIIQCTWSVVVVSTLIQSSNAGCVVVVVVVQVSSEIGDGAQFLFGIFLFVVHREKSWPSTPAARRYPAKPGNSRSLMTSAVSHCPTPAKIERSPHLVAHQRQSPSTCRNPGDAIVCDSVETAIASEKLTSLPERQRLPASRKHKKRPASQEHSRYLIEGPM